VTVIGSKTRVRLKLDIYMVQQPAEDCLEGFCLLLFCSSPSCVLVYVRLSFQVPKAGRYRLVVGQGKRINSQFVLEAQSALAGRQCYVIQS
jgi:hypothetical protein